MERTLEQLPCGQWGRVKQLLLPQRKRRRLLELGLVPGAQVTALWRAPFGGATAYEIMGAVIALRPADARLIRLQDTP